MKGRILTIYMLTAVFFTLLFCSAVSATEYDHEIHVQKMTFSWKIDGANINVQLSAHTKGWVGIGFNPSDQMKDARFVLGYVKNGKTVVTNDFGTGKNKHLPVEKLGGKSDLTVIGGKEEGGVTSIMFSLPLEAKDSKGQKIDPMAMTTVLLAHGPDLDSFFMKHKYRTKISVNLSTGEYNQ